MWPWKSLGTTDDRLRALEERLYVLEERDMESRLAVLDTAERVAARLQDRVRKRRNTEDDSEQPPDPQMLLSVARAQYGGNGR